WLLSDGKNRRAIHWLQHPAEKSRGCSLLKCENALLAHAAGNIKQEGDIKWNLIGITNLRNLLSAPLFVQAKIPDFQTMDRLALGINYRDRHHNQTGTDAHDIGFGIGRWRSRSGLGFVLRRGGGCGQFVGPLRVSAWQ